MTINRLRSPLKRVGGKAAAAERIINALPSAQSYTRFVDLCGGAGNILLSLPFSGHEEIWNDLENNLYCFFSSVKEHGEDLQARLEKELPFRAQWYDWYRSLYDGTPLTSFERAVRYFYVLRFSGTGWLRLNSKGTASPPGWNYTVENCKAYYSAVDLLQQVQARLQLAPAVIDNRDVLKSIRRYDSPTTLFYVDPPYIGTEQYYEASQIGFPHEELAQALNRVKGKVALSYYPHPSLDSWYPPEKWRRVTWAQTKNSDINCETPGISTEMLLCNYPAAAAGLWDEVSA